MTIALASPVSAIGGFMNYAPGLDLFGNLLAGYDAQATATIAVYDITQTLIEFVYPHLPDRMQGTTPSTWLRTVPWLL